MDPSAILVEEFCISAILLRAGKPPFFYLFFQQKKEQNEKQDAPSSLKEYMGRQR